MNTPEKEKNFMQIEKKNKDGDCKDCQKLYQMFKGYILYISW